MEGSLQNFTNFSALFKTQTGSHLAAEMTSANKADSVLGLTAAVTGGDDFAAWESDLGEKDLGQQLRGSSSDPVES